MARVPTLEDVLVLVREEVTRLERQGIGLLGLTVAVPGLIDRARGVVVAAPNLGWTDVHLADALRRELGSDVPVAVDNDANCAARAESLRGVASGVDDFVYLTGTVGLGAGIVCGGQVLRGSRGLAGEVGHLRVGDDRHRCACGRTGCWEALVGLRALVQATGIDVRPREDPVSYAERVVATPGTEAGGPRASAEALARGRRAAHRHPGPADDRARRLVRPARPAARPGPRGGDRRRLHRPRLHRGAEHPRVCTPRPSGLRSTRSTTSTPVGGRCCLPDAERRRTSGAEDGARVSGRAGQHARRGRAAGRRTRARPHR